MKIHLAVAIATASLMATTTVSASSSATTAYVANIRQHIAFLNQASRLAAVHSSTDKLKDFAQHEADSQRKVLDELPGSRTPMLTADAGSLVVASTLDSKTPAVPDAVLTGRSAAIDASVGWSDPTPGVLMAAPGVIVMPHLAMLNGAAFDTLYKTTQATSLTELAGFYRAYKETGDDPALRSMAARELDAVNQQLDELKKL